MIAVDSDSTKETLSSNDSIKVSRKSKRSKKRKNRFNIKDMAKFDEEKLRLRLELEHSFGGL